MKRSILISLLVIGAAATLLGAGTFATWSTSGSDSGTITAGALAIQVEGSGASLGFSGSGGNCPNAVMPGDSCSDTDVTVTNNGTTDVTITLVEVSESGNLQTCGAGNNLTTIIDPDLTGTVLTPGEESDAFTITTTFDVDAGSECQGASGTILVQVTAEAS